MHEFNNNLIHDYLKHYTQQFVQKNIVRLILLFRCKVYAY